MSDNQGDVTFNCDRCGAVVHGWMSKTATSGFYALGLAGPWAKYARAGESRICDNCMWSDPAYLEIYPWMVH